MSLKTRAATFAAGTPELNAVVVPSNVEESATVTVEGIVSQDLVVVVVNLTSGTAATVESVGSGSIVLTEKVKEKALLVIFWSAGLG